MAAPLRQEKGFLAPQSLNLNYPAPLKKFGDQLGGHGEILSMNEDSMIIKPCNELEREFYEISVLHPGFARWMPKYYGTLRLHDSQPSLLDQQVEINNVIPGCGINPQDTKESISAHNVNVKGAKEAICIENALNKFKKPCVMDMKLGTQLWGKDADERKRQKSIRKAESTTSSSMGICITASRVYGKSSDNYTYYSREYCRSLTPDTIMTCFADFFMAEISLSQRQLIIDRFIEDLTLFLEDLENHDVRLRGASLLFIYEGDPNALMDALNKEVEDVQNEQKLGKLTSDEDYAEDEDADYDSDMDEDEDEEFKVTELKIIDFAHSHFQDGIGKDEGCLLGLRNAIRCLKQVLNEITN